MNRPIFIWLSTVVMIWATLLVFGSSGLGSLHAQSHPPIVIEFDEFNPPFMFAQNGGVGGLYPAIVAAAFERMDVPLKMVAKPWPRVWIDAEKGLSGVGGLYKTAARAQKYDYSAPIFQEKIYLYVRAERKTDFNGIESLFGKTIGTIRHWSYGDAFDQAKDQGKIKTEGVDTDIANIKKLMLGRIDGFLADTRSIDNHIQTMGLSNMIASLETPIVENETYIAFIKTSGKANLLNRFNETIDQMREDGTFDRLVKTHLSIPSID